MDTITQEESHRAWAVSFLMTNGLNGRIKNKIGRIVIDEDATRHEILTQARLMFNSFLPDVLLDLGGITSANALALRLSDMECLDGDLLTFDPMENNNESESEERGD